jgi:hypothetical protein
MPKATFIKIIVVKPKIIVVGKILQNKIGPHLYEGNY